MHWIDLFKLSGIVIVVIGFALRLRPTLVVVTAAIVTGLVAGMPLVSADEAEQLGLLNMLGRAFRDSRLVTLFILTLPAIGLAERFGLQEQSAALIRRIRAATVGRLQIIFQLFRVLTGIMGLRFNGHAVFVRPLIYPMSIGAAEAQMNAASADQLPDDQVERIKAANSASENYGNFYGQNLSIVQAGILLVFKQLKDLGHEASLGQLVIFAIPIAAASVALGIAQFLWLDRRLRNKEVSNS
jgi:uncharacterized membrane protein